MQGVVARLCRLVKLLLFAIACGLNSPVLAEDPFFIFSDEQLATLQQDLAVRYAGDKLLNDLVVDEYLVELKDILTSDPRIYIGANNNANANAFANWGDIILFNTGMLDFVQTEGELAGVLSHEIAHLKLHHFTRLQNNSKEFRGLATASVLAVLLSGSSSATELIASSVALKQSKELELRRRYEREADQKAITYLARSGLPLDEYVTLLSRLSPETSLPEYAATHPFGAERVAAMTNKLRRFPISGRIRKERELDFWLTQERVRNIINSTNQSVAPEQWQPLIIAYRTLISNEGDVISAKQVLQEHREYWIVALALAEYASTQGQLQTALVTLNASLRKWPAKLSLIVRKLELLTLIGDYPTAQLWLSTMPTEFRDTRQVATTELRLWQKMGKRFHYRVAISYLRYLEGQVTSAKLQVELAKKMPEAKQTSFMAGRLELLEEKIERLEEIAKSDS